jgi:ligand-binding SRPBCC domain-containing protein
MAEYLLTSSLTIDLPRKQVFEFFSDASNLERITPPQLKFQIVTPQPLELKQGALIDYELKMRGIPVKWRTEISIWNPPHSFTDRQLSGPYKQWIHRHTFTELDENKTLIEDEVKYRLPLEPIGDLAHPLVRAELDRIFAFRQKAVAEILGAE